MEKPAEGADITYVPVIGGFVDVANVLDAWSRRVVGYAISCSIDLRLTLAALGAASAEPKPPPGCVRHSDRGSQYAAKAHRDDLATHGLKGSMGRRGNPYDNAKAESFMKTLKVEAVYPMPSRPSTTSSSTFLDSSPTSTTAGGSIQPSAISVPSSSRINSSGKGSNQQPDPVRRQALPSPALTDAAR